MCVCRGEGGEVRISAIEPSIFSQLWFAPWISTSLAGTESGPAWFSHYIWEICAWWIMMTSVKKKNGRLTAERMHRNSQVANGNPGSPSTSVLTRHTRGGKQNKTEKPRVHLISFHGYFTIHYNLKLSGNSDTCLARASNISRNTTKDGSLLDAASSSASCTPTKKKTKQMMDGIKLSI